MKNQMLKRCVPAPDGNVQTVNGQVYGVWLNENESVRWIWSYQPDGSRAITEYEIIENDKI